MSDISRRHVSSSIHGSAAVSRAVRPHSVLLQRKCACGGASSSITGECAECRGNRLQAKVRIGASNDPLEAEADRVAAQVLAAPAQTGALDSTPRIQRFTTQTSGQEGAAVPASVEHAVSTPGTPLDHGLRQDMEQRFGHDFSKVRVHADALAQRSAQDVNAKAYAAGSHVVFAAGHYAPETREGRRLLAHELTHVVQQSGRSQPAGGAPLQRDKAGTGTTPPKIVPPVEPNTAQKKMIEDARRAAAIRTQTAMFRATGIEGLEWFQQAKRLAQIKFDWPDPNMDQIGEILRGMGGGLVSVDIKVAGAGDPECGTRSGYVRGHQPPIVLCPGFFADPKNDEGRIRTLVHEMAHVKGIGSPDGEQYFPIFDCDSKGAFEAADAWANYVNCLSGQKPDQNVVPTGKKPPTPSGQKTGDKK